MQIQFNKNYNIKKFYNNLENSSNSILKKVFQQAISEDIWILTIQHLSLSKSAKVIVMNSWKERVNFNEIHLYLRSKFYNLYSQTLHNIIQIELSKNLGKSIKLKIIKNDNFSKRTPMESLCLIYQKQLSKLAQNLLFDPNIIMIQSVFDIEFNASDITVI